MRRAKDRATPQARLQMTPMIDVTFLLLIFFMCTLRFRTLEGRLEATLPRDAGSRVTPEEPREPVLVELRVVGGAPSTPTSPGAALRDPRRELEYSVGPWRTRDLDALGERLVAVRRSLRERTGLEPRALLDPREGTVAQDVVSVLERVLEAGYRDVAFTGAAPD